ncbi:ATP-binding cassette domain-containing protein [Streptomyces sp. Tu 2975]|uniref:ATP-binding cassette domain-containing protein n=1 Tax=Streptomyces sp. Tu 2975 TaxID=2676871 RepID=UPI001FC8FB02|nr:ATP-binding cassette domain-containing protein [Streptomyces sp. Tu 2975]
MGRRYGLGGPWVLRGVDLDLRPGTLFRVQGANGSGKSTLLRLLAGIDAPSEGRITGRPRTAYVPERFPAALPFTAAGYLTRLGRIHGLGRRAAAAGAAEWLERFGAAAYARTPLGELSKGTSQKVAVAQALLARPELLVLDEAWTGLDTPAREQLDLAVAELVTAGASVVHVDHDPRRPTGAADTVFVVRDGRVGELPAGIPSSAGREPARWARIVAVGPPGALPPDALPGDPEHIAGEDGGTVFTVPTGYSDALLRVLLTARPPWHIRHLEEAGEPSPNASEEAATTATTAHPTGTGTTA